jgi:glycosyltransferase involved in cell wall biosynthesis
MKILFLSRSLDFGGAERQLAVLARGLNRIGWDVVVVSFYNQGQFGSALEREGLRVRYLNKRGRWDLVCFTLRLIKVIKSESPDIIHGYLPVQNIVAIFLRPLLPPHKVVWGVRASNMDMEQYDWLSRLSYKIERYLSGSPDMIIANSQAGMEVMREKGFVIDKALVIPNGIDTESFFPDANSRFVTRERLGLPSGVKVIGMVARLDPMKDHPTFLKAAAQLAAIRDDVRFLCVGEGPEPYRHHLIAFAETLHLADKLIWVRCTDDMKGIYNALDILTLSSAYGEGFPNVIGEAMACGVPCAVTNVGDSAYIVGDTGEVVPAKHPEALARAWDAMLTRLEEEGGTFRERARQRLCALFGEQALINQTKQALLKLS